MMTAKEYIDSLRELKTRVYMFGEKIENWVDHPMIRPSINCVAMTYALAQDPQYEDLMTATSSLTGKKINRFTHLHQSSEDLVKKVKMQRLLGQKTASCFQRCVGMDAFNAVFSTTYETDEKYGTNYHENFKKFLTMVQQKDLVVDGAMTDPKGELFSLHSKYLQSRGYNVMVLDLRDPYSSYRWNPLDSIWDMYQEYVELGKGFKVHKDALAGYPDLERVDAAE